MSNNLAAAVDVTDEREFFIDLIDEPVNHSIGFMDTFVDTDDSANQGHWGL